MFRKHLLLQSNNLWYCSLTTQYHIGLPHPFRLESLIANIVRFTISLLTFIFSYFFNDFHFLHCFRPGYIELELSTTLGTVLGWPPRALLAGSEAHNCVYPGGPWWSHVAASSGHKLNANKRFANFREIFACFRNVGQSKRSENASEQFETA